MHTTHNQDNKAIAIMQLEDCLSDIRRQYCRSLATSHKWTGPAVRLQNVRCALIALINTLKGNPPADFDSHLDTFQHDLIAPFVSCYQLKQYFPKSIDTNMVKKVD